MDKGVAFLMGIGVTFILILVLVYIFDDNNKVPSVGLPDGCTVGQPKEIYNDASTGHDVVVYSLECGR